MPPSCEVPSIEEYQTIILPKASGNFPNVQVRIKHAPQLPTLKRIQSQTISIFCQLALRTSSWNRLLGNCGLDGCLIKSRPAVIAAFFLTFFCRPLCLPSASDRRPPQRRPPRPPNWPRVTARIRRTLFPERVDPGRAKHYTRIVRDTKTRHTLVLFPLSSRATL